MEIFTVTLRHVLGRREDEGLKQGLLVFNAPRPLAGTQTWQGEFRHGVFYAAVDPQDTRAVAFVRHNIELDAVALQWIDEASLRDAVQVYYDQKFPELHIDVSEYTTHQVWASYIQHIAVKTSTLRLEEREDKDA